jgi:hypothetical protein
VRESRTLRAMWRGLETDARFGFQGTYRQLVRYAAGWCSMGTSS